MSNRRSPDQRSSSQPGKSNSRRKRNTRSALSHIALISRRFARIGWAGAAALAVLLALALSFVGQAASPQRAAAAPAQKAWAGRASAPDLPPVIHFSDLTRGTAYTVWLRDTDEGKMGSFVFTLRDHTQLSSFAPISQTEDNSFIQITPQQLFTSTAANCNGRITTVSGEQSVNVFVRARIDTSGLVAYAQVAYGGCGTRQSGESVMLSGCTPTACTDVLAQVSASVQQYDASVVTASASHSQDAWSKVYAQVSQTTRGQYTPEQFATQLDNQIASVGQITAVSPIIAPPVLQYDTAGQAFFAVKQQITYSHNGTTTTRDTTSYYLIESGQWVFWFSA